MNVAGHAASSETRQGGKASLFGALTSNRDYSKRVRGKTGGGEEGGFMNR